MPDEPNPTTAAALSRVLGPLRRAVLRNTRAAEGLPDLPDTYIEILRTVATTPAISPRSIADQLGLARPTVSNLIQAMRRDGLLDLARSDKDARVVKVTITEIAAQLLSRYDTASAHIVSVALNRLTATQRAAIAAAVPALAALQATLGTSGESKP